jgi:hypothetical protein
MWQPSRGQLAVFALVYALYVVVLWTGPDFARGRVLTGVLMAAGALALCLLEIRKTR